MVSLMAHGGSPGNMAGQQHGAVSATIAWVVGCSVPWLVGGLVGWCVGWLRPLQL